MAALADDESTNTHSRRLSRADLDATPSDALTMNGLATLAGPANVIMQLSLPAVGYGVYESRVDSGNLFKHPIKRTRTTLTYLAVAAKGSANDRKAFRAAVNRAHAQVRSTESSPVRYNAFDPSLQLWVAACLYRGWEDVQHAYGDPAALTDEAYRAGAVMGTTLQVPAEMWPATRVDFETYWQDTLAGLEIDETIRGYLLDIARLRFAGPIVSTLGGWWAEIFTIGFLPEEFQRKMGVTLAPWQRRVFNTHNTIARAVVTRLPQSLREFPFNLLLADMRRRARTGRPLI